MALKLPDILKRSSILYGKDTPRQTLVDYGMAYEERGRLDDAVQFYTQAKDEPGLERIKVKATDIGDAFLVKAVAKAAPGLVSEDDWKELARRAESLGKHLYAEQARAALQGSLDALEPEEKRSGGKRSEPSGERQKKPAP